MRRRVTRGQSGIREVRSTEVTSGSAAPRVVTPCDDTRPADGLSALA